MRGLAGPVSPLISKYGGPVSFLGNVFGSIGTAPAQPFLYPRAVPGQAHAALTGIYEGPLGTYQSIREYGGKDTATMLWESLKQDYQSRYGDDWKSHARENSLFNLFDALAFLGAGARGATLLGASQRLGAAGEKATLRNLWKESSRPGLISEGEPFQRHVRYQPDTGPLQTSTQPWSRSPLRRGTQAGFDALAEKLPNVPVFGARSRISRSHASTLRRTMDRFLGGITGEEALNSHKLGDAGRSRLFWESQLGTDDDASLQKLRNVLAEDYDGDFSDVTDPELGDFLRAAKQQGFGTQLLKRLDDAIAYKTDGNKHYERARDSLRQMTVAAENTIEDSEGFTSLSNDLKRVDDRLKGLDHGSDEGKAAIAERIRLRRELAAKSEQLTTMFRNRRGLLRDFLDTKGDNQYSRAWHTALTAALGEEQANVAIAFAHALANKIRPDDPESWWAGKVGMPSMESAALFRKRVGDDALFQPGQRQIFDELVKGDPESAYFHSPLQKAVNSDAFPETATVGKYRSLVQQATKAQELENTGVMNWLDALPGTQVISKQDILVHLANKLNDYNLEEFHFRSGTVGLDPETGKTGPTRFETRWDKDGQYTQEGVLLSRKAGPEEYNEIVMKLPGGRELTYQGRGSAHWGMDNVVVHMRFHIFEEDGVKKMLIEEIQSDWYNDAREAKAMGLEFRLPTPEELMEMQSIQARLDPLNNEMREIDRQLDELFDRFDNEPDIPDDEMARMEDLRDDLRDRGTELEDQADVLQTQIHRLEQAGMTAPPLGDKHANAAIRRLFREAVDEGVDEVIFTEGRTQHFRSEGHGFMPGKTPEEHPDVDWAAAKEDGETAFFKPLYEEIYPNVARKEYGIEGTLEQQAYRGRFSTEGGAKGKEGWMSGTVFRITDAVREKAAKSQRLYQESPDPKDLPKGAVELFSGGKSRVHLFEGGDVSTWIHELGHVAMHDLSPEDQGILSRHYAGGVDFAEWKRDAHENFARDWEGYVREGTAPTRALGPVFAKLAAWVKAIWEREKIVNPELSPEIKEVFAKLFRSENEPDIFMPHRAGAPDLGGGRTSRAIPRANREIGDRGAIAYPPLREEQARTSAGGTAERRPAGADRARQPGRDARASEPAPGVRAGDGRASTPRLATQTSRRSTSSRRLGGEWTSPPSTRWSRRTTRRRSATRSRTSWTTASPTTLRSTRRGREMQQLYVVDKKLVDMLFKNVTGKSPGATTKPKTNTGAVIDAVLDSVRALLLYANPGFYVTNMLGNTAMTMLSDPRSAKYLAWSMKQAVKAAKRPETARAPVAAHLGRDGQGPDAGSIVLASGPSQPGAGRRDEQGRAHSAGDLRPPGLVRTPLGAGH